MVGKERVEKEGRGLSLFGRERKVGQNHCCKLSPGVKEFCSKLPFPSLW